MYTPSKTELHLMHVEITSRPVGVDKEIADILEKKSARIVIMPPARYRVFKDNYTTLGYTSLKVLHDGVKYTETRAKEAKAKAKEEQDKAIEAKIEAEVQNRLAALKKEEETTKTKK